MEKMGLERPEEGEDSGRHTRGGVGQAREDSISKGPEEGMSAWV